MVVTAIAESSGARNVSWPLLHSGPGCVNVIAASIVHAWRPDSRCVIVMVCALESRYFEAQQPADGFP